MRKEFELYAKLLPAKGMSGDFFDFFYLNDDTLDYLGVSLTAQKANY
jgi:hypothetical protein